jgi:hypothetical protein
MGVDLSTHGDKNKIGSIHFNWSGWHEILRVANEYGWKPMGTTLEPFEAVNITTGEVTIMNEDGEDWDGGYGSNDFQVVSEEDALNMREALLKALADGDYKAKNQVTDEDYDLHVAISKGAGHEPDSREEYGWLPYLEKFTKFLENGEFHIG